MTPLPDLLTGCQEVESPPTHIVPGHGAVAMLEALVDHKFDHNKSVGNCGCCTGSGQDLLRTSGLDRR
jgi:hypothetical protein